MLQYLAGEKIVLASELNLSLATVPLASWKVSHKPCSKQVMSAEISRIREVNKEQDDLRSQVGLQ